MLICTFEKNQEKNEPKNCIFIGTILAIFEIDNILKIA